MLPSKIGYLTTEQEAMIKAKDMETEEKNSIVRKRMAGSGSVQFSLLELFDMDVAVMVFTGPWLGKPNEVLHRFAQND